LIVPVSAILLGALFLGERLELVDFAGMALIAIGLVTIDGRLLSGRDRRNAAPVEPSKRRHESGGRGGELRPQAVPRG
jgi:hypothetical protein